MQPGVAPPGQFHGQGGGLVAGGFAADGRVQGDGNGFSVDGLKPPRVLGDSGAVLAVGGHDGRAVGKNLFQCIGIVHQHVSG